MNRFLRYPFQEEAGAEDKSGGGDAPKMFTAEEVQALIEKEVAGLKANQEALLAEKKEAARKAKEAEEQRQRADETGETNRIVRAIVAKGFEHLDGNLIDRPRFMQDLPEHRAERDDDRQEAQRTAHPFLHRRRDFIQRHAGEETGANRNHHQSHEGVHSRLHD